MQQKIIYFGHPVAAETPERTKANIAKAKRWLRWIYMTFPEVVVLSQWMLDCEILDDFLQQHREIGMAHDRAIIPLCNEGWFAGGSFESSTGMRAEADQFWGLGRIVRDFTYLGSEPPPLPVKMPPALIWAPSGWEEGDYL